MGHANSNARRVQRKTGALYMQCLMKIRDLMDSGGYEAVKQYVDKVRSLPDAPVKERVPVRCLGCLCEFNNCSCKKET